MMLRCCALLFALVFAVGCATSPLGRRQIMLFPEAEMQAMGIAAFDKIKTDTPAVNDPEVKRYVRCVAEAITAALPDSWQAQSWEVAVFQDDDANAFAVPGGKIGVYTGMLQVATTQDQLAAVIGHEVAHVLANHTNERISTAYATETGVQQLVSILSGTGSANQERLLALLGIGAQVGVTLPFSRTQESEADILGLELMARAGFDPRASVALWQRMGQTESAAPPEFLSTHPSSQTRIQNLNDAIPSVVPLYERARSQGKTPRCAEA